MPCWRSTSPGPSRPSCWPAELSARPELLDAAPHRRRRRRVQLRRRPRRRPHAGPRPHRRRRRPPRRARCATFVAGGRPVVGICNGFQVLTRTGLLPGRPRPQRRRPLRLPLGRASPPSRPAGASGPPASTTSVHCPIAHGEGRYVHPDPDGLAAAGQVALRYVGGNPNGSVADIAGVCDETGVVLGLMPHPENHVARPPAPAPPPRPDHRRAPSGCACSKRRCAMSK